MPREAVARGNALVGPAVGGYEHLIPRLNRPHFCEQHSGGVVQLRPRNLKRRVDPPDGEIPW